MVLLLLLHTHVIAITIIIICTTIACLRCRACVSE